MAATVEIEPFVTSLRERLAMKLENHMNVPDVLAAFDRATVEAVFSSLNGKREKELTPQQRGAQTRARNRAVLAQQRNTPITPAGAPSLQDPSEVG